MKWNHFDAKNKFSGFRASIVRIIRVMLFRIEEDLCFLRASSLTFYSILSVVPVLAVVFGIAKGFGMDIIMEDSLKGEFKEQEQVIQYLIQFGYSLLEQTRGGVVAGIGVITLLYTVLNLFSTIEASLNYMWGLKAGRSITRKVSDYLALILVCPIFFTTASSLTVFITTQVEAIGTRAAWLSEVQPLMQKTLILLPYAVSTILFTFLYIFMPNTRVRLSSALIAGVIAAICYQILQGTYISLQIQLSKVGAIYGSFAALPLFLFWLYLSWIIFLVGAEIVVIHQERLWDPRILAPYRTLSQFEKDLAYLAITKVAVDAFEEGKTPVYPSSLSLSLQMPLRLIGELIEELTAAKIIVKTKSENGKSYGVTLAQNPDHLRIYDVISTVHGENLLGGETEYPFLDKFAHLLKKARERPGLAENNPLLKDIHL